MAVQLAVCEFQNHIGDPVEKIAVMGHHKDCAAELFQIIFEPFHSGAVNMVRRFVQNQNIAGVGKNTGHGDSLPLAAGQKAHLLIKLCNTQLVQHGLAFIIPLGERFRCQIADGLFQHSSLRIEGRGLWKIADAHTASQNDSSGIRFFDACSDPKKCRLSCAVNPDQTDLIAFVHRKRKVGKQRRCCIRF